MKGLERLRKLSSDEHKTVLQHPDGHQITIAHKMLSPEHRNKLDALQHFADGGMVQDEEAKAQESGLADAFGMPMEMKQQIATEGNIYPPVVPSAPAAMPTMPDGSDPYAQAQTPQAPEAIATTPVQMQQNAMQSGADQVIGGLQKEAAAQGALGQETADIYAQQAAKVQELHNEFKANEALINEDIQNTMADIKEGHIDPDRYINNKSTVGKVSSAIGLLLGGMGAGLTGGENPALKYLSNQIDHDITAQKADMGKKENLLSANFKQLGNMKDAMMMTKAMYGEMYANKIAEAAAKSTDPLAKARAQQAIGQIKLQMAPAIQQMAQRQTAMNAVKNGKIGLSQAAGYIVPEKDKDNVMKEIAAIENLQGARKNISDIMDQTSKLNTVGNRITSPLQSKQQIDALNVGVYAALKPIFGVLSETDKKDVQSIMNSMTGNAQTDALKKKALLQLIDRAGTSTPYLDQYPELKQLKSTVAPPANNFKKIGQ